MTQEHQLCRFADVETASDDYASRFAGPPGRWLLEVQTQILREFLGRLGGAKPLKVLDVGGGHGQIAAPLIELGCEVTVVGSTAAALGQIRGLVEAIRCHFITANLAQTGLKERSYDLVTCIRLLTHSTQWQSIVAELCRLSSKAVVIDYPPILSSNFMYPLLFGLKKRLEGNTRSFRLFRHAVIDQEFAKHGFRLVERRGEFFWPMVMHRLLKNPKLSELSEKPFRALGLANFFGSPTMALFMRNSI